jgi:hypothetical protein
MPKFSPYQKGKRAPAAGAIDFNSAPDKKKQPYGNVDKAQKIASAGEVIPLVFCKRSGGVGGVWMQPSLIKAGVRDLNSSQAFPICQGAMIGTPKKRRIFVGLECLAFLARKSTVTASVNHRFVSAATYASAPNTCPYPDDGASGMLYCGIENYTYFETTKRAQVNQRHNAQSIAGSGIFYNYKEITRASGNSDNTTYTTGGDEVKFFDNETGSDLTAAYWAELGYTAPFPDNLLNRRYNPDPPFQVLGGRTDGTIQEGLFALDNDGNLDRDYLWETQQETLDFYDDVGVGDEGFIFQQQVISINTQQNTSFPANESGALTGIQRQFFRSTRRDISAYPSTDDFSSFADITLLQITSNAFQDFPGGSVPDDLKQIYVFYADGVSVTKYSAGLSGSSYTTGSSNQLVDLALHLFSMIKRSSDGIAELAQPVKTSNLQAIGTFCSTYSMFFNGVLDQTYNLIEYISEIAPFFLLAFLSNGGRYEFSPLLPVNGSNAIDATALTPAATFTESDILPGSYQKIFTSAEERRDVILNVIYRNVTPRVIASPVGAMVRFSGTADDAPVASFDMSEFCAKKSHAVTFAKYELARRKHSTHSIEFETALNDDGLKVTDIVKVQRQRTNSLGDNRTEIDHYQITSISYTAGGTAAFEAMHFPLTSGNIAKISNDLLNGSYKITNS